MEITPFAGGMPPEPEVDSAEAPAVQPASLAGPAASLGQLAAAALDASAPGSAGSATTRQAEQSVLAQAVRQHLHNQVGDLPGPIPDAARALSGRDQVSYTPIQLPNVAEDEEEEPVQRNTLDGGGALGGPGRDLRSFTPIPLPDTLDRREHLSGSGRDLRSFTPIPLPDTLDRREQVSGSGRDQVSYTPIQLPNVAEDEEEEPVQRNTLDGAGASGGPGGDKISYTPITIPNTLDGAGAPGGPGGDKISYTPITIPNTLDGGDAPPGPGGGDPVRLK